VVVEEGRKTDDPIKSEVKISVKEVKSKKKSKGKKN
jgi:hypothetical protein